VTSRDDRPEQAAELRRRAEEMSLKTAVQSPENLEALSPEETQQTIHELRVHQIELEMQNEELRRAQTELDAARERYFDLYDLAPVSYCTISEKGLILEANLTAATLLGVARGALVKQPFSRFILKEDQEIYYLHRKQLFEKGESQEFELRMVKIDGTPFWGLLKATAAQDGDGAHVCRLVLSDITVRKQAEVALKSSEEFIRDILSSIDEAFVVIDRDYQIISANRAFCEQTGMPLAHIIGKHCYEISHCLTRPCHEVDPQCACKRTFETGEPSIFVYKLTDEECNQTHLEIKTYAMKDEAGNVKSVIEIINDITERTNLETQLRRSQKMEAVGTLAGGIAHDFNNILTAIIGFGYLALMEMGPEDPQRQNIGHILEGADRAAHLTNDLLIFSRKQVSQKGPVDLNEIIGKVEKFLVRVIGEDINCSFALHNEPIVVYADPHQLEQVLMNLATNARDAMAKVGDLVISAEQILVENDFVTIHGYGKPGRYALLTISDTGEGMDEATRKKIFDPFFTTKEVGKGTGLGLAVVYGIVKEHEGFINVYSEPGSGTSFKIYLPLISSDVLEEEITYEKESPTQGTETILLAEDDKSVRELVSTVLEQQGYTVIQAVDGKDAVKKFMENRETIHLLLSDLIMPKMHGKEAYDEMKVWRPDLKVIFASGYAPDFIRQKMLLESNVVLIHKPILPYALLKKVRSILDEGEKQVR
jgi:two-component system cell cycle sensor histidine kinase/response regulator CckA